MFSKRSIFTTAGLILLVGLTNYLSLKSTARRGQAKKGVHITGTAETASMAQMTALGKLDYSGNAAKVVRYSNGKARLYQLSATLFNQKQLPPWQATSDNAWSYPNNSKIDLWGNVHFWRKASAINKPLDYQSPQLTLYPHRNYAETATKVRIAEPGTSNVTTAVGMEAWPKAQKVKLLSKVKSIYEAPKKSLSSPDNPATKPIPTPSVGTTQ